MTEKTTESIFVKPLWMTQTQKIITHIISKFYKWILGMCMIGGKFLKEWQMKDKITEWFFVYNSYFYFMNDSN